MLSWAFDSMQGNWASQPPKMVTGRVTKNLLAVFQGGNRETIEVRLKFTAAARVPRPECQPSMEMQPMRPMESAMTPRGVAEWSSFIQSNPQIGHSAHVSRVASPALSQGPPPSMIQRRGSFCPSNQGMPLQEIQRVAPVPVDPATVPSQPTSRPASRTSKKKQPTGRPRGRPRKKPAEGNTSGYEDGTEGEDAGPTKKRVKTTKIEKAAPNPFTSGPESLRVAASASGSLRTFRPIAANNEVVSGNHLQEVPRAPTPVPEGGPLGGSRGPRAIKPRRESSMRQEIGSNPSNQYNQKPKRALSPSQEDGRSPESLGGTPAFSEDSPQDMRSSPPVPRMASFMQSSPPPSSPMLPPMLAPRQEESSFDADDLFDEPILQPAKEDRFRPRVKVQRVAEVTDSTGIPTQVFQIQRGPGGQDLVHIQNYNTPHPTSAPAGPPQADALSLPPLKMTNSPRLLPTQPPQKRPQPVLAPTPPPTTDAPEKAASPALTAQQMFDQTVEQMMDEMNEPLLHLARQTSSGSTASSTESNPTPQEGLPRPEQISMRIQPQPQPRAPRQISRSQSAGAGPLVFPVLPASEPLGPSALSQSIRAEPLRPSTEIPSVLRRSNSIGPFHLPSLASDPVAAPEPSIQVPVAAFSEAPCPPSDAAIMMPSSPPTRSNKNLVKKQSIKQRLEKAIANGEMPPFCTNCGAIETPTWRKIWVQDHEGVPEYVEYSEKPGRITAIDILKRDDEDKPLAYRLIKKSLGGDDDRKAWLEQLLCNPCGIWVSKYRSHRPQDKWDNSFGRLGQDRRKRGPGQSTSRAAKRARTKSMSQPNFPSEAYPATDPLGPVPSSPKQADAGPSQRVSGDVKMGNDSLDAPIDGGLAINEIGYSNPGSTHSRGSGTAGSPIQVDFDAQVGKTRRLLFPSPRKGVPSKTLGEINANIIKTVEYRQNKELSAEKENMTVNTGGNATTQEDDMGALFGTAATARPSTPPPKARGASHATPFKTPTQPTPNHRPVTRSVSRSLRSVRGMVSPSQQTLQKTPCRTPVRRSPRNHSANFDSVFDTPLSRTITQMLSEPSFDLGNGNFDLSSLPVLDTNHTTLVEFGNFLSTDGIMPSSPPKDEPLDFGYSGADNVWAEWGLEHKEVGAMETKD